MIKLNTNKSFGKYLVNEKEKKLVLKNKITFGSLMQECCRDYDESDDSAKLAILKDIIIMILTLMNSDKMFQVEVKPFNLSE